MRKILTAIVIASALILYSASTNTIAPSTFKNVEESNFSEFKADQFKIIPSPSPKLIPPSPSLKPSPSPKPSPKPKLNNPPTVSTNRWKTDYNISWYGPGFYGNRTACGLELTKTLIGVAHKTLKCGTIVVFKWDGVIVRAPVVDRGPYVAGRQFDMTGGLCVKLNHCFTGKIYYMLEKG